MRGEEDGGQWRMMEVETHQQRHYSLLTAPQSLTNYLNKNILSTQSKQEKKKKRHDEVKKHKAQRKTNKKRIIISKLKCNIGGRKEE